MALAAVCLRLWDTTGLHGFELRELEEDVAVSRQLSYPPVQIIDVRKVKYFLPQTVGYR